MSALELASREWPRHYDFFLSPDAPVDGKEVRFYRVTENRGGRTLLVKIVRDGLSWFAEFERGDGRITDAIATPSPDDLCVIASGQGYWVSTLDPGRFEPVVAYPIREVHALTAPGLLAFVDDTTVAAYGLRGLLWQTERISSDGIKINEIGSSRILGHAWDARVDREVAFSIDVVTGIVEGGLADDLGGRA